MSAIPPHPIKVEVDYLDSNGRPQYFCRESSILLFHKIKDLLDLSDDVTYIEIYTSGHPCLEVSPENSGGDMPSWIQWIFASSDDGEDAEGELINWVNHSPDLTEKETREVIEEFFQELLIQTNNQDIHRLVEEIPSQSCTNLILIGAAVTMGVMYAMKYLCPGPSFWNFFSLAKDDQE